MKRARRIGSRAAGTNPRARGTNLRARRVNPRAQGTNPRAIGTNPATVQALRFTRGGNECDKLLAEYDELFEGIPAEERLM